jgi:hypothetical protein
MGESKRRKNVLGEKYGQESRILPWLPITKAQSEKFVNLTSTGAWVGIGIMIAAWFTVRFVGPAFGWWKVY